MTGTLQDILHRGAESTAPRGMVFYAPGNVNIRNPTQQVTYSELLAQAATNSCLLRHLQGFQAGQPVLLHLQDHWDTILWFWSVVLTGGLPTLSSPFSNVDEHRRQHIFALSSLLQSPICITREESLPAFDGHHSFRLCTVESLVARTNDYLNGITNTVTATATEKPALLMLTSGSSGNAKAVELTYRQVLAAITGKAGVRQLPKDGAFLNWIGLDHVASLVEMHLQALWLGVDQVHVPASTVASEPTLFLDLLSYYRVSRSFAPNFFLARLVSELKQLSDAPPHKWNLSTLTVLASGGETNAVTTCVEATALLQTYGAREDVITPGFGMTETCAGSIYNLECPRYDVAHNLVSASLGQCMHGIEMRVTVAGDLEVRGDAVFGSYYRNPAATAEAFTSDGWFRTGDLATIDTNGNLHLTGRAKDIININGVKFETTDVQTAVDQALGALVSRVIVFPARAPDAPTEQVVVAYIPKSWPLGDDDVVTIGVLAVKACIMSTGARPLVFPVGEKAACLLPMTTLGKISRAKMRSLFEEGFFSADEEHCKSALSRVTLAQQQRGASGPPPTEAESLVLEDFVATLPSVKGHLGTATSIFSVGFTSMDLIRLKHRLDARLGISVPVITLLKHPTARSLAAALRLGDSARPRASSDNVGEYDPVVSLVVPPTEEAAKTPLWLVHPGVGEVLVFLNLSHHLARLESRSRPVYALRARGFEPGQQLFANITDTVTSYIAAIRRHQPKGPYALAGYSYGTMLAFEIAKVLQASRNQQVLFLGSFNLPPHIKHRMRQLNWNMCLLHLASFLGVITPEHADEVEFSSAIPNYRTLLKDQALTEILTAADETRLDELGLTRESLSRWVEVAYGLQSMAVDYEPSGSVKSMDVFHAIPLRTAAASREEWVNVHLKGWEKFCDPTAGGVRFHEVKGEHYTMIGPEFVEGFAGSLVAALAKREREGDAGAEVGVGGKVGDAVETEQRNNGCLTSC